MPRYSGYKKSLGQKKPPLTHFLCLPLVTPESRPQLECSLRRFREAVELRDFTSKQDGVKPTDWKIAGSRVHPKAIRPVGTLHCTLGVMSLDADKLSMAIELLQSLDVEGMMKLAVEGVDAPEMANAESVSKTSADELGALASPTSQPPIHRSAEPMKVTLKGLVSMHSPRQTSILYSAPVDSTNRLYPFCLAVQKKFKDAGFLVPDDRPLKLHATIVNTIYAKGRRTRPPSKWKQSARETPEPSTEASGDGAEDDTMASSADMANRSTGHGSEADVPLKMDASIILDKFKDFIWAENVTLDRLAICEMGAKKVTNADGEVADEVYTEVITVKLPI